MYLLAFKRYSSVPQPLKTDFSFSAHSFLLLTVSERKIVQKKKTPLRKSTRSSFGKKARFIKVAGKNTAQFLSRTCSG